MCSINPRGSVLKEAYDIVNGDRHDAYGSPEDSFALIADFWDTYLRKVYSRDTYSGLTPKDVAVMMVLFKVAREAHKHKRDNLVDCAAYAALAADVEDVS